MAVIWTVYSGTLSGPASRTTQDPAQALQWARGLGPEAFVTNDRGGERRFVWSPESDRRCVGELHNAVIDRALSLSAVSG
jgi:hypothetical protein